MEHGYPLRSIAAAMGATCAPEDADHRITELVIDSRRWTGATDALFFALKGQRHDGHDHVAELAARGPVHAVVNKGSVPHVPGPGIIAVDDTLFALQRLVAWHRARFSCPVVGITGSNGKTIVKEWLDQALRDEERIIRSPASWNSQVGVPLSVWGLNERHTLALFEAGISLPGEMERLLPIIAPTIGVLTNIGAPHSEGFADDVQKAQEKCVLFRNAHTVVACIDQDTVRQAILASVPAEKLRLWSRKEDAFVRVVNEVRTANATRLTIRHAGKDHEVTVPFVDAASIENAITVITVLLVLGRDMDHITERVAKLVPVEMRLHTTQGVQGITLIDDSYSNDLVSLRIALDHHQRIAQGRPRVVVLGDIAESGLAPGDLYAQVGRMLRGAGVGQVIAVGPLIAGHASLLPAGTRCYADASALLRAEDPHALASAVVLVKGARHLGLERVVERWQYQIHGTVLEVDLDAVRHNLNHYRALLVDPRTPEKSVKVMAMVKAFGYGSGALELARLFAHERVHYLGVAYADEGIELRRHGITTPVLVMNPEPVPFETLHRYELEPEVYDARSLRDAIAYAAITPDAPPVHIKLDTGMHRLGFSVAEFPHLVEALRDPGRVRVASILSHLAASEDPQHDLFTRKQISAFTEMAARLAEVLGYSPLRHIANSGAVARFPEAHLDMVRLGIGLHGVGVDAAETRRLLPTATLRTVIAQVKTIPAGDSVSYGRRFVAERETRIAVLPIGYADGLSRRLGNGVGKVWIHGKPAPFLGSICMDMCMVDVTDTPCRPDDPAIVFGPEHPLQDYAHDLGTIPYEALTSISARVRRVYTQV